MTIMRNNRVGVTKTANGSAKRRTLVGRMKMRKSGIWTERSPGISCTA